MKCPKCQNDQYCKDGIVKNKQRYKCKGCHFRYTVERKSNASPPAIKKLALEMYLEGMGFRSIGRVLKVSFVSVYNWIKAFGEQVELVKSSKEVTVVELDEMHTYIGSKKKQCWVWIAVDRHRHRYIAFECGSRGTETGLKLWEQISGLDVGYYCSDYWKSYSEFLPKSKHVQTKAETYTVEGYNSRIRHYLARFRRKGKCYSKAKHMIEKSLNLLMMKLNNELSILC